MTIFFVAFKQLWPRTGVEKLLNEMFDCPSAQFLAIEEALGDSNRRIAMSAPAANENEFELLDVALELLLAAEYLAQEDFKALVTLDDNEESNSGGSQMAMAIAGGSEVRMAGFLRVVKFAFNYECWEVFRRLSTKIISFIQVPYVDC